MSADGKLLALGSNENIYLWDLTSGRFLRQISYHISSFNNVAIRNDYAVRLWDLNTGKEIRRFSGHTSSVYSIAISNDNRWIVSGSGDGVVRLWRL